MIFSKIKNKTTWLFVLLVIYVSDDNLLFGTNQNELFIYSKYFFYTLFNIVFFIEGVKSPVTKHTAKIASFLIAMTIIILLSSILNSDLRNGSFLFLYTLFTAALFSLRVDFQNFGSVYVRLLYFFSVISLIAYVINLIIPEIFNFFPTIQNYGGISFKFFLFGSVFEGFNFARNLSVFREPGIFAIHLCFSLILQLFGNMFVNRKFLIVTIIALFTTLSTTGILVLGLMILFYIYRSRNLVSIFYSTLLFVGLILLVIYFPQLFESVFSKLDSNSRDYASSFSRLASFYIPLEIIKENLFLGVGLGAFVDLYAMKSRELYGVYLSADSAATNTFLNIASVYGIAALFLVLFAIYRFTCIVDRKTFVFLMVLFIMLLSSQELRYSLLFSIILIYGVGSSLKNIKL